MRVVNLQGEGVLRRRLETALSDEDKNHIRELFSEEIAPKLNRLHARIGAIGCEFAGPEYQHWLIRFRSRGSDFEIVDFEYDEHASDLDLDL